MPKKGVSKESIGITIDKVILKQLDEFCKKNYNTKRSVIVEKAVMKFLEENSK